MHLRFWPALLFVAVLAPLRGQDQPIHMRPEFPLVFPLVQNGREVTVKYPVLINPTTVLKPGMRLRVLYILSVDAGGNTNLALAHKGNTEAAYARASGIEQAEQKLPPEMAHEIEGYRRTIWEVPNNFVLAMAQYPTVAMHLIFTPADKNRDLYDERFSFFEGLFVGLPDGKVTVIAVEKGSHADQAGIKAGDEIVAIGCASTRNDLATFAAVYEAAKKTATDNEVSSYAMSVRTPGSETRSVQISMPPRLKGGLMDGFH